MQSDLLSTVRAHGNLVRTARLFAAGHSRRSIGRAIASGAILRVCHGWVATAEATQLSVIAVAHRGSLTGSTALASRGTWDGLDRRIHIRLPVNAHGPVRTLATPLSTFAAPRFAPGAIVRHWVPEVFADASEPEWRSSVIDALVQLSREASVEQFVACAESALHERTLSRAGLPHLGEFVALRMRPLITELDSTAGSGLESITRLRLAPLVRRIQTQVALPGIARGGGEGRVDFLIDNWLVIEVDGDEHHDERADRIRNSALVRLGLRWHRFGHDQVLFAWPDVEETVLELLRYPPVRRQR